MLRIVSPKLLETGDKWTQLLWMNCLDIVFVLGCQLSGTLCGPFGAGSEQSRCSCASWCAFYDKIAVWVSNQFKRIRQNLMRICRMLISKKEKNWPMRWTRESAVGFVAFQGALGFFIRDFPRFHFAPTLVWSTTNHHNWLEYAISQILHICIQLWEIRVVIYVRV